MRQKICFLNVNEDGLFTLWDKPQQDTQPMAFTEDELGVITVEPVRMSLGKRARLAAAFALSNMGHQVPENMAEKPYSDDDTPRSQIDDFGGHLMESDEHEEIFAGEAEMWYKTLGDQSINEILRIYGPHSPWIEQILLA